MKKIFIKIIPNSITCLRIILSIFIIFLKPLSLSFFIIYVICGFTDIFDGYFARKNNVTSDLGATLDSIADFTFIAIMIFILLPIFQIPKWGIIWISIIIFIRLLSLIIGSIKYKTIVFLHTYLNKTTGIILFISPLIYSLFKINFTLYLLCIMGSISAIEELLINITSKKLSKNIKSFFDR